MIFDCDGVLVDSEPITLRVMRGWVRDLGWDISEHETAARFKGVYITSIQADVEARLGRPVPDFIEGYRARMFAEFARGIDPVDGVPEMLDALDDAGIPCCVASNGPHVKMAATLTASGLAARLGGLARDERTRIFSAEDVARPKPAADLFLYAADRMRAAPAGCLVVEDSPSGIVAARAAGMPSVGFADITPAAELLAAGADAVITSMRELPALLGLPVTGPRTGR